MGSKIFSWATFSNTLRNNDTNEICISTNILSIMSKMLGNTFQWTTNGLNYSKFVFKLIV